MYVQRKKFRWLSNIGICNVLYSVAKSNHINFRTLHPVKYYRDYLSHNIRPDGRELDKFRPVVVNAGTISTADGSAIVKLGKTTIVCGIKAVMLNF